MMTAAILRSVHPVLPTQNVGKAIDYYVKRLGFVLRFQDSQSEPGYVGVARDGVELHLQWHDPKEWSAVERPQLRFLVEEIDALYNEYSKKGVFHGSTALRDTAWGTREFAFFDGDKNGLVFYCDVPNR